MRQEIKKESRMVPHHLLDVNKDLVLQDDEMDKTLSSNNRCWKYSTTFGAVVCFLVLTLYVLLSSNDASSIIGSRRKLVAEQKSTKTTASTTIFYAIGDAPYDNAEAAKLKDQMMNLPKDAEFVVHVGDFTTNNDCPINEYKRAVSSLKVSPVPVFVILGDNDWNDCKNPEQGLKYWKDEFLEFDKKYWKHDFSVIRQPNRMENFALIHKQSLFIGLNLVAGKVLDKTEWSTRFKEQLIWMKQLIRAHALRSDGFIGRVVLLGHTDVTAKHSGFFDPLRQFIQNELNNTVPILYINGDIHKWIYTDNFLDQPSSIRISLTGKAREPPLRVTVHSTGKSVQASKAFIHDRRLDIMTQIINFFQGIFG